MFLKSNAPPHTGPAVADSNHTPGRNDWLETWVVVMHLPARSWCGLIAGPLAF